MRLVTLRECASVKASHGLAVVSEGTLDETFNWLVVPGGNWAARKEVGAWGEISRGDLPRALARRRQQGVAMASVCTGAMLLSAAGITRGRHATTHREAIEALRGEGALIVEARVVDDGDLITAGGVTSGIDLALWFIERNFGKAMADGIAQKMEYPYGTSVWRASSKNSGVGHLIAPTPTPPYYAVLFTRVRRGNDEGYAIMGERMRDLAHAQPGFLGVESVASTDGGGITLSYWISLEAIAAWKAHSEHRVAQERGNTIWYEDYRVRIAKVEREYGLRGWQRTSG